MWCLFVRQKWQQESSPHHVLIVPKDSFENVFLFSFCSAQYIYSYSVGTSMVRVRMMWPALSMRICEFRRVKQYSDPLIARHPFMSPGKTRKRETCSECTIPTKAHGEM